MSKSVDKIVLSLGNTEMVIGKESITIRTKDSEDIDLGEIRDKINIIENNVYMHGKALDQIVKDMHEEDLKTKF